MKLPTNKTKVNIINIRGNMPVDVLKEIIKKEQIILLSFIFAGGGKKPFEEIYNFCENGKIKNVEFFISDYVIKMNVKTFKVIKKINEKYGIDKIKINTTHNKILLIKTKDNNYTINSTANIMSNNKVEHTEIFNNKKDYDFYRNFGLKYFT